MGFLISPINENSVTEEEIKFAGIKAPCKRINISVPRTKIFKLYEVLLSLPIAKNLVNLRIAKKIKGEHTTKATRKNRIVLAIVTKLGCIYKTNSVMPIEPITEIIYVTNNGFFSL